MAKAEQAVQREIIDGEQTIPLLRELHEVHTVDGMRLALGRKRPVGGATRPYPALLLHGFGQNRFTWTLSRRSFANFLVAAGFEVFTAELRGHGLSRTTGSRPARRMVELSDLDLPALVEYVIALTGAPRLILLGHSLGGILALAAPPVVHARVAAIVTLASPCTAQAAHPLVRLGGLFLHGLTGGRPYPAGWPGVFPLDWVAWGLEPFLPWTEQPGSWLDLAMWHPASMEPPVLLELLREGYDREGLAIFFTQVNWLTSPEGAWQQEAQVLDRVARLQAPVLLVAGDRDQLAPPRSVEGWLSLLTTPDRTFESCGGGESGIHFGHCDLINGRHAPRLVWPRVLRWLDARLAA